MAKNKSKRPTFPKNSRMRRYNIIFDESVQQNRVAFYKYKLNSDLQSLSSEIYVIPKGMEHRLDLISIKFFGTAAYDWLIAEYNNIEDPIRDVVAGKKIRIPNRSSIGII